MLRPALPFALLALGITGTLIHAATPSASPVGPIEDIEWSYSAGTEARLQITREGMRSTFDASDLPEIIASLAASSRSHGEAVSFNLAREAGALACTGRADEDGDAEGTCRFDPNDGFVADLSARGLRPEDGEELLALALVDARLSLVDDLSRAGFVIEEAEELIAVAALDVGADYSEQLRTAGLAIDELEDLIAARAVELDAAWLKAMAEAGYPNLTAERAIQMRALDITPDYARRMKQVAAALGESL